jgi:hypothetical protein
MWRRLAAGVTAIRRVRGVHLALLFAIAGCGSFDKRLLDYASGEPSDRDDLRDAGHRSEPSKGDPQGMPKTDASVARDSGVIHGATDAGHARPPATDMDGGDEADSGHDDAARCEPLQAGDYCAQVPALPAPPVIDGVLDCGLALTMLDPQAWNGTSAMPAGHVAKFAVAARPDGLYVYVEVHGQTARPHPSGSAVYCGDAVEFYVDADGTLEAAGNYDKPGTMQFLVAAPGVANSTVDTMRYVQGTDHSAWLSSQIDTALLADGYAVEAFITAADLDLSAWAPATRIGLDLAIDVSAPSGTANLKCGLQLGQYFLHVDDQVGSCNHEPWCDTHAFCTPAL